MRPSFNSSVFPSNLSDSVIESAFARGLFSYPLSCIAMTYATDGCLATLAQEQLTNEEQLVLPVGMIDALAALHDRGFIHDDIKLPNFVRTSDGTVQLIDFQSSQSKEDPPQGLSPLIPVLNLQKDAQMAIVGKNANSRLRGVRTAESRRMARCVATTAVRASTQDCNIECWGEKRMG
jgi:serine/threonine protein kinase